MKVLILNWRDVASPRGGGAERVTHEVARRLVQRGHEVSWLSSADETLPRREMRDGISIVRRGGELTTHLYGPVLARQGFDVVVDAINTIPYLAPVWSRAPVVALIHQLARDVWWYEAPRPLAVVGWLAEPVYLQAYRRTPVITVSRSTRDDLRRLGLRGKIHVIPLAATDGSLPLPPTVRQRPLTGRLVVIGRLTPSKRVEHAIAALAELRRTHPDACLDVIGVGAEQQRLQREAARLGIIERVRFHGRIRDEERDAVIAGADAVVGTSVREGWGLIVTEAALLGTPAVTYDIPGFRDSIIDRRTGILTAPSPPALADGIRSLLADRAKYDQLREAAREQAAVFNWSTTAVAFEAALEDARNERVSGRRSD